MNSEPLRRLLPFITRVATLTKIPKRAINPSQSTAVVRPSKLPRRLLIALWGEGEAELVESEPMVMTGCFLAMGVDVFYYKHTVFLLTIKIGIYIIK